MTTTILDKTNSEASKGNGLTSRWNMMMNHCMFWFALLWWVENDV